MGLSVDYEHKGVQQYQLMKLILSLIALVVAFPQSGHGDPKPQRSEPGAVEREPQRKFDHCEYLKKDEGHLKRHYSGSVVFDRDKKAVEFLDAKDAPVALIPNDKIKDLILETKLPALPFHAHSMTDFFTIHYVDSDGKSKSIVINMDKCKHREMVTEAPGATGKPVSYAKDRCCVW